MCVMKYIFFQYSSVFARLLSPLLFCSYHYKMTTFFQKKGPVRCGQTRIFLCQINEGCGVFLHQKECFSVMVEMNEMSLRSMILQKFFKEPVSLIMFCVLTAFHLGSHWLYPQERNYIETHKMREARKRILKGKILSLWRYSLKNFLPRKKKKRMKC